jgi:putative phosphoesterase
MTTRLAIITDVHADVHAVRDALTQIRRLQCTIIVCAGDLIDYGLFPVETIDLLAEHHIPCVRGNHDRWAVSPDGASAKDASGWDLPSRAVQFLAALPSSWSSTIEGIRIAVHHASPGSDMAGIYPEISIEDARRMLSEANADVLLVGHTHLSFALEVDGAGLIVNPGALLRDPAQPMEGRAWLYDRETGTFAPAPAPGGGTFAVLELPAKKFTVHRASDGVEVEILRRLARTEHR